MQWFVSCAADMYS